MTTVEQREWRILISAAAASSIAWGPIWVQPLLLSELLPRLGTPSSASSIVSLEIVAIAIFSELGSRMIRRHALRTVLMLAALIAASGNCLSLLAGGYVPTIASRLLAGAGEGLLLMVSITAPARLANPDRAYSLVNIGSVFTGMAMTYAAPGIARLTGVGSAIPTMLISVALFFPLLILMPADPEVAPAALAGQSSLSPRIALPSWILGLCAFLYDAASGSIWSFSFVFGERLGLSPGALDHAMTASIACGLVSSLLVVLIGDRFGRLAPIVFGLIVLTVADLGLSGTATPTIFRVCLAAFLAALYFLIPYTLGQAAVLDRGGRGPTMIGVVMLLAQAAGPYLGGMALEHLTQRDLGWLVVGSNAISLVGFCIVTRSRALRRLAP